MNVDQRLTQKAFAANKPRCKENVILNGSRGPKMFLSLSLSLSHTHTPLKPLPKV